MARNRIGQNGHTTDSNGGVALLDQAVEESQGVIKLPPLNLRQLSVTVVGISPLITHPFPEKAKKQMRDKQSGEAKDKRSKRNPQAEYLASMYVISGKAGAANAKYGVPARAFKQAIVSACRYADGVNMTFARGALFVMADADELIELKYKKVRMREDVVRLQGIGKPADLRYRAEWSDWQCRIRIRYNASVVTRNQLVHLLSLAGFHSGLLEMRPERGGDFGMWKVSEKDIRDELVASL